MMMKDINTRCACGSVCVALVAAIFVGCSHFQEDDLFDESAAQRITHFNEQLQSRLVTQSGDGKYGWVIQYFVASDYEGFNLFGSFSENGKVKLAGNHRFLRGGSAGKYTESVSAYDVLSEDGPVLAFNTWNDVLTVFVDPVNPSYAPSTLVNDGEGLLGDQNLVYQGYRGDTILFAGERNSARIRFVPCDRPWRDYIADTEALKNKITNSTITSYYVFSSTDTLYFKNLRNGIFTYCERVNDPLFPTTINCVFTPTGFYLQHKNDIKGTTFQEFTLADDKSCLVSENDSVKVVATWDSYIANSRTDVWNFDQEQFTEEQKSLLGQIDAEARQFNSAFALSQVGLGRSSGSGNVKGLVLTFSVKNGTRTAGLSLTTTCPAYGRMQVTCSDSEKTDSNLANMGKKTNIEALVRQFAATLAGTYDIVPNDYFLPTSCELHAVDGSHQYTLK